MLAAMRSKVPMVATARVTFLTPMHWATHDLALLPLEVVKLQIGKGSGVVCSVLQDSTIVFCDISFLA